MLEQKVHSALFGACEIRPGQTVLVGFSGGADSLCLLALLARMPVKVIAACYDHGLRSESRREVEICRSTARWLGVDFVADRGDVQGYAEAQRISIEEAARIMRYRFLFTTAEQMHADAVAVGHHADDQVETVLMHLMRGAGPAGLAGMRFRSLDPVGDSAVPIIRPLLGIWRTEIEQFCSENHLTPNEDLTNQDAAFFRNRIRLELLPELQTYNSGFKQHLWQTAAILADENDALNGITSQKMTEMVEKRGQDWIVLNFDALRREPFWLQRRLVRKLIFDLKSSLRDVDYFQIERILAFIAHPAFGKTIQMDEDLEIFRHGSKTVLLAKRNIPLVDLWPQVMPPLLRLPVPTNGVELPGGWELIIQEGQRADFSIRDDPWEAFLDAESFSGSLSIGGRQPGEIFEPYGMNGANVKVGDFFTNAHLPSRARDGWPLLRSGERIIWIPGFRISEACRVTDQTKRVLHLKLIKK